MKPKVFLSLPHRNYDNYINPIKECGGIPYGIHFSAKNKCKIYTDEFDGLVLCGGGDIDPELYNQSKTASSNINLIRDEAELDLVLSFALKSKPILGICRGIQVINVAFGGSLTQNIANDSKLIHTPTDSIDYIHNVISTDFSLINSLFSSSFYVNSYHHQAIRTVGYGLNPTSYAPDGIIESLEHKTLPIIAVQWHPERLCLKYKNPSTVDGLKLFDYFINLCDKN